MKSKRVTIAEAKMMRHGEACPADTNFPCRSIKHNEWATPSKMVYTRCDRCKRPYILIDPTLSSTPNV